MKGKICVVTGANTGIGKATALGLAKLGARVVLACRDVAKAEVAAAELRAATGSTTVDVMALDLGSLASVRAFADAASAKLPRIDVLVENAGVSTGSRALSADGYELDFAVNHLGHFLLTELLLPKLRAAKSARVVVVSSSVHTSVTLDFDDLMGEKKWSAMGAYAKSKLANMLYVRELARRLAGTGVTVNAVHPGVIASELARDFPAPFRWIARLFFKSTEAGARTSLYLATSPEVEGTSGGYFADSREAKPGKSALDDAAAARLWKVSEELVARAGAKPPIFEGPARIMST